MLHGLGGRRSPGGVRDTGPAAPGPTDHHPRRTARGGAQAVDRGLRGHRGQSVRLLYPGHRHAVGRPGPRPPSRRSARSQRRDRGGPFYGADRSLPAGPPVPLHRLAEHRGSRSPGPGWLARPGGRTARPPAPSRPGARLRSGPPWRGAYPRRSVPPRSSVGPGSPTTPARPARWWPCPTVPAGTPWPRRCGRPGLWPARCRVGAPAWLSSIPSTCPRVSGTSPCRPPGWSRPTSSPTPRGVLRAAGRRPRWPTAGPSAASDARR